MSDTSELLKNLNNLTMLTGKLSDMHEKNLKLFPYIFFHEVEEVKIEYDLSRFHDINENHETNELVLNKPIANPTVSYYLKLNEEANNELEKRCIFISTAVKTLLWSDVKVEVYLNNKIKFKE